MTKYNIFSNYIQNKYDKTKNIENGYLQFPNNYMQPILSKKITKTIRPIIKDVKIGDILKAVNYDQEIFAELRITNITLRLRGDIILEFKLIKSKE